MSNSIIPALKATPERIPTVEGNFKEIEKYLLKREEEIKALPLEEGNLELVKAVHKEVVAYRTSFKRILEDLEKTYFKNPMDVFKGKAAPVLGAIARMEELTKKVLDKEEEDRLERLTELLNLYRDKFQEKYSLEPKFLERIEYRKQYYNKTAEEKWRLDDMEAQFAEAKKAQSGYRAAVALVEKACEEDRRLDRERWVAELDAFDSAEVLEHISREKERLNGIEEPSAEPAVEGEVVTEKKLVLGAHPALSFKSDFPGRTKKAFLEMEYPVDAIDAIKDLFRELRKARIVIKTVKERETVF
jgi:hypothetical protein